MKIKHLIKSIIEEVNADKKCDPLPDNFSYKSLNDACFFTELNSIVLKKFYHQTVPLPVIHTEEPPLIQYYEKNTKGSDYVIGDIHCQFNQLEKQLLEIGFDKKSDRLFAVGDLIDRGEGGYRALNYSLLQNGHSPLSIRQFYSENGYSPLIKNNSIYPENIH